MLNIYDMYCILYVEFYTNKHLHLCAFTRRERMEPLPLH
jgi:hypothetical protein